MLISIIIPTHNRLTLLKRAVNSVLEQTYRHFEVIIVNDASTDDTRAYLDLLCSNEKMVKVIHQSVPGGGSVARNAALEIATGKWIAFLDDDDWWDRARLVKQVHYAEQYPDAVAFSCGYQIYYPFGIKKTVIPPLAPTLNALLMRNILGGASVCFCLRETLLSIGGFDAALKSAQDWDVWLKLRFQGPIYTLPSPLVHYQVHFNYRISNNMRAKYLGSRRLYLKYACYMETPVRRANIAFIWYLRSRYTGTSWLSRLRNIKKASALAQNKVAIGYLVSSLPRLLLHPVLQLMQKQR